MDQICSKLNVTPVGILITTKNLMNISAKWIWTKTSITEFFPLRRTDALFIAREMTIH